MNWMGFVLGLAGIMTTALIGVLNSRLTQKGRISPQVSKLYEKRLEAYGELMHAFSELVALCTTSLHLHGGELKGQRLLDFRKQTENGWVQCNTAFRKWSVFLPLSINLSALEFLNAYCIVAQRDGAREVDGTGQLLPERDPEHVIVDALYAFANAARIDIGVEELSSENQFLIKKITGRSGKPVSRENAFVQPPNGNPKQL
jgi:hypothetical protein